MNQVELIMRRRSLRAFIDADPVTIVISRQRPPVKTEGGGSVRVDPLILPPQRARIVQNVRRYNPYLIDSEAGDIPRGAYVLLGLHTLDVEANDTFFAGGNRWVVKGVHPVRVESVMCSIDFEGAPNG